VLSPRVWGWTVSKVRETVIVNVVPTRVGVDRQSAAWKSRPKRCPHACGGGPYVPVLGSSGGTLSPRVWGWTDRGRPSSGRDGVVPTRVGVDRSRTIARRRRPRCPHACGGGPTIVSLDEDVPRLSPRVWGWTAYEDAPEKYHAVVPTRVGVDRRITGACSGIASCPHACGGGPDSALSGLVLLISVHQRDQSLGRLELP